MNPAEAYILKQPQHLQDILLFVRSIIFKTLPTVEEKYRYKIPFYFYNGKPLCYLNILKGTNYIDVGFWNGFKLTKNQHFLIARNRKMVKSLEYYSLEEINVTILEQVLIEASILNQ